ncbi:hypothetical protein ANN_25407 [Periplaneta americana]|uniref:Uncharacterized protein n=1 Tax=Periplaneta americana TaxID=6978 RepID=A0ABQ8S196_PERAM|nr:hypothetical protein ANN_25407 [Periplaneta americana]
MVMQEKKAEIESEFYGTDAMINRNWTGPNNKLRSAITRLAVHTNCAEDQSTTNLPLNACANCATKKMLQVSSNAMKEKFHKEFDIRVHQI